MRLHLACPCLTRFIFKVPGCLCKKGLSRTRIEMMKFGYVTVVVLPINPSCRRGCRLGNAMLHSALLPQRLGGTMAGPAEFCKITASQNLGMIAIQGSRPGTVTSVFTEWRSPRVLNLYKRDYPAGAPVIPTYAPPQSFLNSFRTRQRPIHQHFSPSPQVYHPR